MGLCMRGLKPTAEFLLADLRAFEECVKALVPSVHFRNYLTFSHKQSHKELKSTPAVVMPTGHTIEKLLVICGRVLNREVPNE